MIGHAAIRKLVEEAPPKRPLIFIGPSSVGKRTLAEHLAIVWGIHPLDVIRINLDSMDNARSVASLASRQSDPRLFIIEVLGAAPVALNVLLKTLEEAQPTNHFILITEEDLGATITSRCDVHLFNYLNDSQVARVLEGRNFHPDRAAELAATSGGTISGALSEANDGSVRIAVLAAVLAIQTRDEDALEILAQRWTDAHTSQLSVLCTEFISKRFRTFRPDEVEVTGNQLFLRILRALNYDVRPRFVVRSSLMAVLRSFT